MAEDSKKKARIARPESIAREQEFAPDSIENYLLLLSLRESDIEKYTKILDKVLTLLTLLNVADPQAFNTKNVASMLTFLHNLKNGPELVLRMMPVIQSYPLGSNLLVAISDRDAFEFVTSTLRANQEHYDQEIASIVNGIYEAKATAAQQQSIAQHPQNPSIVEMPHKLNLNKRDLD